MIRLGYACINTTLERKYRTCRLTTMRTEGMGHIRRLALENVELLRDTLLWNLDHDISFFRVTSDIIPFGSHPEMTLAWWEDDAIRAFLDEIASLQQKHQLRLSTHPGQYTVLNSPNPDVVKRSIAELSYHARLMELIHADDLILHVGGVYGDKTSAKERFTKTVHDLDDAIRTRIRVENDDVSFNAEDALEVAESCQLPMCFDYHHHRCLPSQTPLAELKSRMYSSWGQHRPKVHLSSGRIGPTDSAHHEFVHPEDFEAMCLALDADQIDVMLEAKKKEQAVLRLASFI